VKTFPGQLSGMLVIEPVICHDHRGFFLETWNHRAYQAAGVNVDFVQDNLAFSQQGILRGLHFQNPNPQGKLVSVLQGAVFDVAVDLRRSSPTFKQWCSLVLSAENHRQCYIPPGCAHGYLVLSSTALFHYKCSAGYSPKDECTLRWNDPDLAIDWPAPNPIVSEKDAKGMPLSALPEAHLFS
jgi:dTDP-4-dehydrorhamnose 3,5-epimerase